MLYRRNFSRWQFLPVTLLILYVHAFYTSSSRHVVVSELTDVITTSSTSEMTFIVIVCSSDTDNELASNLNRQIRQFHALVKSAVIFSIRPLHFILVVDSDAIYDKLAAVSMNWPPDYSSKLRISKKSVWYPSGLERMKNMFRTCATQRLFLENMFPELDSAIYIDTDFLFLRPVDELYEIFRSFSKTAFSAMAPCIVHYGTSRNKVPYYGETGLNAGLMLVNFTRIRAYTPGFQDSLLEILNKYEKDIILADQDLLNIFFSFHPNLMHELPCSWNYRPLLCYKGEAPCAQAEQIGIDALHGNAMVFLNDLEYKFRRPFEAFEEFQIGVDSIRDLYIRIQTELDIVDEENQPSKCKRIQHFNEMILSPIRDSIPDSIY